MGYVGAPYNFVSFSKDVYEYSSDKQLMHNVMVKEGMTGEITYEITAKTPIFVDNGNGEFHRNAEGKESIPGSTMRGLIRSNVQILGLASMNEDVDDYLLMYRNVANGAERKRYGEIMGAGMVTISQGKIKKQMSILKNVKAGYVKNENGKYYIYQTEVDRIKPELEAMNYYVLSERKIVDDYLCSKKDHKPFVYDFCLRKDGSTILQHEMRPFKKNIEKNKVHYKGEPNKNYKPYYIEVSYEVTDSKDVVKVGQPGKYAKNGYAVSTGKMTEKKAVYIIPKLDEQKPKKQISDADLKAFQIDINKRENTLKSFGGREWFDLPEEGKMKPIFYIELDKKLYFGFTPRLRLFYDYSLKRGLMSAHKEGILDYSTAMFGYSRGAECFKSKLSFSDAVVQGIPNRLEPRRVIQAEPKPTSYLDYLNQDDANTKTYNQSDFQLRGVKQYWLHEEVNQERVPDNQKRFLEQFKPFRPLEKETKFVGKVRFQNLTEDELGLLLWSIKLNNGSQMNVGKAKAHGYGRIEVKIKNAKVVDLEKAYFAEGMLVLDPYQAIDVDKTILSYKSEMNRFLKNSKIDELPHVREFFMMKDAEHMPDEKDIRYMSIQAPPREAFVNGRPAKPINEYQERRNTPLPTVAEVVQKK